MDAGARRGVRGVGVSVLSHVLYNPRRKAGDGRGRRRIDEPGGVPYKPRQSRARTEILNFVSDREAANGRGSCVQRRRSRETNLPAEQIGAQAPARFSRPHGDQRRPQGRRGAADAWAQAPQCVSGIAVLPSSSGSNAAAIFGPRPVARALPAAPSYCRRGSAPTKDRSA
jgi:hypothetical protein